METLSTDNRIPPEIRRLQMLDIINSCNFAHVKDLSAHFQVSRVTIQTDLDQLAAQGYVQRLRGGARPQKQTRFSRPASPGARISHQANLEQAAANLVCSGETILLAAGTLATGIARVLVQRVEVQDLVVFTNSLSAALELEPAIPRFSIVVTGGTLDPLHHALVNPLDDLLLAGIRVGTLFLTADGIDPRGSITTDSLAQAESKRRMLQIAQCNVVIAASDQLGSLRSFSFCTFHEIDICITDKRADPLIVQALQKANVQVILVETDQRFGSDSKRR